MIPPPYQTGPPAAVREPPPALSRPEPSNLADVLERVLDKGIVIAGDIRVNLFEIELLTIRIRLLVASVDRAREMGIDWWEHDPMLSSRVVEDRKRQHLARSGYDAGADGQSDAHAAAEQQEQDDSQDDSEDSDG